MIVDTLMIILVYDTWLYDDKKKSYSMSETGENSATQGEVRQNKVRPQWVKDGEGLSVIWKLQLYFIIWSSVLDVGLYWIVCLDSSPLAFYTFLLFPLLQLAFSGAFSTFVCISQVAVGVDLSAPEMKYKAWFWTSS